MTNVAEMTMALRAVHFQLQYLEGFLRLKAGRVKVLRGRGRGGGEYTVLDVRGYPGDVVQKSGEVPPGLKRKCLGRERSQRVSGLPAHPEPRSACRAEAAVGTCRGAWRENRHREGRKTMNQATEQGTRRHVSTEHGWAARPTGKSSQARAGGWVLSSFSWEGLGLGCCFLGNKLAAL